MTRCFGRCEALHSLVPPLVTYGSMSLLVFYSMWPYFYYVKGEHLVLLGVFSLWRYGWLAVNYIRALIYAGCRYPRLKRMVRELPEERKYPSHVFFVILVYREEPWITIETMQSVLSNLVDIPCRATLVVSTGCDEDDRMVTAVHEAHPVREKVELVLQRQRHGKRIAMGHALRAIARRYEDEPDSVTVFMDGDSWLEPFVLRRCIPFFARFPRLGALTTNEIAHLRTGSPWYKHWFNLKFGQRHVQFQSHALSWKVLTLTGRFSVFRTSIVVEEPFIRRIEADHILHWRHGKFRFLMGDDKSSWFHLLEQGWDMLYLPDVIVHSLESRDADFLSVSISLMRRWYGNTLRNNPRALALGPHRTGYFIWYALLEQRISMWTPLVGLVATTLLSLTRSFVYLPFYIGWVLAVRSLQTSAIAVWGHPVSQLTVPLMLYSQWVGALVKIHAWYHLSDQCWSKGSCSQEVQAVGLECRLAKWLPSWCMTVACLAFLFAIAVAQGVLTLPSPLFLHALVGA